jgi:hypothetical protein
MQRSSSGSQVKLLNLGGLVLIALLPMLGCGEAGRVRLSQRELVGRYVATLGRGDEQLELRSDKTYTQVFSSPTMQFTNQGTWESRNEFFGGTVVELRGANLSEGEPPGAPFRYGFVNMNVHKELNKLRLAINEAGDIYYERVD